MSFRRLFGLLSILFALTIASPVAAANCVAYSSLDEDLLTVIADEGRWKCGQARVDLKPERALLRFAVDHDRPLPTHFLSRRNRVEAIHLATVDSRGNIVRSRHTVNDQKQATVEGYASLHLPPVTRQTAFVIAAFDKPTSPVLISRSFLSNRDPMGDRAIQFDYMLMAFICGMLLMPLVFNVAFYRILRERFLIWHSVHVAVMIIAVSCTSGLITWLIDIPLYQVSVGATLSFGAMIATGTMFAHSFIEPGKLHPWLRKALPWTALVAALNSALHAAFPFVLRAYQLDIYMIVFLPVLFILVCMVVDALRRGSRAMIYQMVAWGPMIIMSVLRQISYLTPLLTPTDMMTLFYFGCAFEVFATAMAIADRMVTLRKQRDIAVLEAQAMGDLSERDALTGLFNRRAIEERFSLLRAEGFTTLAVLDLDLFKQVNDTYGHAVGDEVLRAASEALQPEENVLAIRLGGEEFLLLLRGPKSAQMAEQRRQAITHRVATSLRLDRPVTASMGLVEAPPDAAPKLDFAALYSHADRLLYEAKATGRNRTVSERMRVFRPRKSERRAKAA